jgi:hypothetical protein
LMLGAFDHLGPPNQMITANHTAPLRPQPQSSDSISYGSGISRRGTRPLYTLAVAISITADAVCRFLFYLISGTGEVPRSRPVPTRLGPAICRGGREKNQGISARIHGSMDANIDLFRLGTWRIAEAI